MKLYVPCLHFTKSGVQDGKRNIISYKWSPAPGLHHNSKQGTRFVWRSSYFAPISLFSITTFHLKTKIAIEWTIIIVISSNKEGGQFACISPNFSMTTSHLKTKDYNWIELRWYFQFFPVPPNKHLWKFCCCAILVSMIWSRDMYLVATEWVRKKFQLC